MTIHDRVARLRLELTREGLAGFLVPRADEHQGEYVPPRAQRLGWITGFTGSAGLAIIATDAAAIFVDGRYTLQVRDEAPGDVFEFHHVTESPPSEWLRRRLKHGDRLGYDPWLHTIESVERLQAVCAKVGATLVPVAPNLVDRIWEDQPTPPRGPIVPHDLKHAGRPSPDKRGEIGDILSDAALRRESFAAAMAAPVVGHHPQRSREERDDAVPAMVVGPRAVDEKERVAALAARFPVEIDPVDPGHRHAGLLHARTRE